VTYRREQGGEKLQEAVGHSSAAMTELYNRPSLERQIPEVDAMRAAIFFDRAEGGVQ